MDTVNAPQPATPATSAKATSTASPRHAHRRHSPVEDDLDAWLVSFADLAILVLSFFVVLYAASRIDVHKAEQIKESLAKALTKSVTTVTAVTPAPSSTAVKVVKVISYDTLFREIQIELDTLGLKGLAQVDMVATGVSLTATGDLVFSSGSAEITPRAIILLNRIVSLVNNLPYYIRIEGHTDDIPIHTQQFPSNWELSAARAGRVARFLIERGITPNRIAVTGYAETRPLPPGAGLTTTEQRAANRRVVFLFEKMPSTMILKK